MFTGNCFASTWFPSLLGASEATPDPGLGDEAVLTSATPPPPPPPLRRLTIVTDETADSLVTTPRGGADGTLTLLTPYCNHC